MLSRRHLRTRIIFGLMLWVGLFLSGTLLGQKLSRPLRVQSTDPAIRLKGFETQLDMVKGSPFKALNWSHIGPTNVSGRSTDIAVVAPRGKNYTIYVATASGGVWKTVNEGTTWEPVFEDAASTAIGDIAIDPAKPDTIWVGTGEANIFRSSQAGCGIYKSLDGGKTWAHMGLADTYTIARIVVHPQNPDIVYVAASGHEWTDNNERGVFKTADGGKTWDKILFVNERTGAIDLAMDPSDSNTLYASTWQRMRLRWNDRATSRDTRPAGSIKRPTEERPGGPATAACRMPSTGAGSGWISALPSPTCSMLLSTIMNWPARRRRRGQRIHTAVPPAVESRERLCIARMTGGKPGN